MAKRKLEIHDMVLADVYYFAKLGRVIDKRSIDKSRIADQRNISDSSKYLVQFDSDIHYKKDVRLISRSDLTYVPVLKKFSGKEYSFWDVHSLNDHEEMLAYDKMTSSRLKQEFGSVRTVKVGNALLIYVLLQE